MGAFYLNGLGPELHLVVCKNIVISKDHYEELVNRQKLLSENKKVGMIGDLRSSKMFTYNGGQYAKTTFEERVWGAAMVAKNLLPVWG
ncbi:MAG: hypothetical protein K9K87_12850 [Desulfotignum sp.]|nr:hypothetical protein [Desulfotignum sp.]